jgi:hypothetical protein
MRVRKTITQSFTPQVAQNLKLKDFLGKLTEAEIKLAKKHGIYKWDAWVKNRNSNIGKKAVS